MPSHSRAQRCQRVVATKTLRPTRDSQDVVIYATTNRDTESRRMWRIRSIRLPGNHSSVGDLLKLGSLRTQVVDRGHGVAQLGQPLFGVLADQFHRPGQRIGARPGHARVDQGVEHLPLRLLQPRHDRDRDMGEQDPLATDVDTPGNLAAVAILRLVGDVHPFRPGFLAKARDTARSVSFAFFVRCFVRALWIAELTDYRDLLPVDDDSRVTVEPGVGQASGEPVRCGAGVGLAGLLPAAGTAVAPPMSMMVVVHAYMITPFHSLQNGFRRGRTATGPTSVGLCHGTGGIHDTTPHSAARKPLI